MLKVSQAQYIVFNRFQDI